MSWWKNPIPAVCGILTRAGEILLIQRNKDPYLGFYDLPGGFCEEGEDPEASLVREFLEETGLAVTECKLLGIVPDVYADDGCVDAIRHTLNIFYRVKIASLYGLRGSPEGELSWWPLDSLPKLAFPASTGIVLTTRASS